MIALWRSLTSAKLMELLQNKNKYIFRGGREMTQNTYNMIQEVKYIPEAAEFIRQLHKYHHIPLNLIDVNDWQCNLKPSVYVHNKRNLFNMKRISRFSGFDIRRALKHIKGDLH